jgi:hypothetical protein
MTMKNNQHLEAMTTLEARLLTLNDVHRLFGFQRLYDGSFTPLLSLQPITNVEQQELVKIRDDFEPYLAEGQALEGQIRFLAVAPLLRLAGYYSYPIHMRVEENIAKIELETETTSITGRFDLVAVSKERHNPRNMDLWAIVIETKPILAEPLAGVPQVLTYAYKSLDHQKSVWGLVTNGLRYQFLYIHQGDPPTYWYMPLLSLSESASAKQLLQVLKAICKL